MNRSFALLTCIGLLTTSPMLLAQAGSTEQPAVPARSAARASSNQPSTTPVAAAQPAPVFNLTFKGGSAAEYVEAVRQASGGTANVLVMPDANRVDIPALTMTGVSVRSAIYLLNGRARQTTDRSVTLLVNDIQDDDGSAAIFTVDAKVAPIAGRPLQPQAGAIGSQTWSLSQLIDAGVKIEDALSAIETGLNLYPKEWIRPEMRFHKETGLLLARGEHVQLAAIDGVLSSLNNSMRAKKAHADSNQASTSAVQALESRVASLETQLEKLAKRLEGESETSR